MSETWKTPSATEIRPPLFLGKPERDFVKQIGKEVAERIMAQVIFYLAIDIENTKYHDVYGEAIRKTFLPPVKVHALVDWKGETTKAEAVYIDRRPSIMVYFLERRLEQDQEFTPREGDFVKYGRDFYEIVTLNRERELFGHFIEHVSIAATCVKVRENVFNLPDLPDAE